MSEHAANIIADAGTEFGARCARLISGLERASMQGGNGFKAKTENDLFEVLFEVLLERSMEVMRDHSSDEACELFEAMARLEYWGALALASDRIKWRKTRWAAWQEIAGLEAA